MQKNAVDKIIGDYYNSNEKRDAFWDIQIGKKSAGPNKRHCLELLPTYRTSKGETMKSGSFSVCSLILSVILCALIFLPCACRCEQLGETAAEGHRRHKRVLRINQQELIEDVDRVLLLDQPSRLTDKRIP